MQGSKSNHLLYASRLFTPEEIERMDGIFANGNFPFDIVTYHVSLIDAKKKENALQRAKANVPIPKQGSVKIGSYRFKTKKAPLKGAISVRIG